MTARSTTQAAAEIATGQAKPAGKRKAAKKE